MEMEGDIYPEKGGTVRGLPSGVNRGFTLIEIVLVLTILSLTFLLVLPDFSPLYRWSQDEAALRKTAVFLNGIHSRAVTRGEVLTVVFDGERSRFVAEQSGDDEAEIIDILDFSKDRIQPVMNPPRIEYYPLGNTSGAEVEFQGAQTGKVIKIGVFSGLANVAEK